MRRKRNLQQEFNFQPSNLKVTNDYFRRYAAIDAMLRENQEIVDLVHADLEKTIEGERKRSRRFDYTSETVLRMIIVQMIEGLSQRALVIRIDDSYALRRFVRVPHARMMDFSTYNRLKNTIELSTWKQVVRVLARSAVVDERITGEKLRLDTTAVETARRC